MPLVVRLPDRARAGEVLDKPVSLVDVAPTVLAAAGLEPDPAAPGVPLQDQRGAPPPGPRVIHARIARGTYAAAAMQGDRKLLREKLPNPRTLLLATPGKPGAVETEVDDSALRRRLLVAVAEHERRASSERAAPNPTVPLTPEQLESLQALGYVDDE